MKKLIMLVVAGMFAVTSAAYACDGMPRADKADKIEKAAKVAKKAAKPSKKSDKKS